MCVKGAHIKVILWLWLGFVSRANRKVSGIKGAIKSSHDALNSYYLPSLFQGSQRVLPKSLELSLLPPLTGGETESRLGEGWRTCRVCFKGAFCGGLVGGRPGPHLLPECE